MATAYNNGTGGFDQYTNLSEWQGKKYHDLPLEFRIKAHETIEKDELTAFKMGRADSEVVGKVQQLFDQWVEETNPSTEQIIEQRQKQHEQNRIMNLQRQLSWAKAQLVRMDKVVANDGVVPFGQREKLRAEINGLEREIRLSQKTDLKQNKDIQKDTEDWINSLI